MYQGGGYRVVVVLAIVVLAPVGCGDSVTITGRALREDGAPLPGELVTATTGTIRADNVETDTSGRFSSRVRAQDSETTWSVVLWRGEFPVGPNALVTVPVGATLVDLGELPAWRGGLQAAQTDSGFDVSWTAGPADQGPLQYALSVEGDGLERITTVLVLGGTSWNFDGRAIQDQPATVSIEMTASHADPDWIKQWWGDTVQIQGSWTPLSRGASCRLDGASFAAGMCPVTDGDPAAAFHDAGTELVVDLGQSMPFSAVSLLLVHPDPPSATLTVAISDDCVSFSDLDTAQVAAGFTIRDLAGAARCVSLRFSPALSGLTEIGVW